MFSQTRAEPPASEVYGKVSKTAVDIHRPSRLGWKTIDAPQVSRIAIRQFRQERGVTEGKCKVRQPLTAALPEEHHAGRA